MPVQLPNAIFEETIFSPLCSYWRWDDSICMISGFSILSHWSTWVCLCWYHTVLITEDLWYILKSGSIRPQLYSFFKTDLAISWSFVVPYRFYNYFFCFCKKGHWDFDKNCVESVYHFGKSVILRYIWDPWTWSVFPFVCVLFNFLIKCFIVFSTQVFHFLSCLFLHILFLLELL